MASLLTIPLELLVAISAFLPTQDLGSLRLACKQTEKSLYEWFSKEFFSKKQFMLTHESLQALVDISKHVGLSKKLTHVIIATNVFEEIPLRFRNEDSAIRYIQGYEDQKALLSTGFDREMLTEAFQRLENLQTIGIRDFDSHSRIRDGKSWTSWGATTVYRETGIRLQLSERNQGGYSPEVSARFASRVFSSVLYALGKANRQPPEFEVLLRHHGLPDSAFFLPDFTRPTVEQVLCGTKTLLLTVDLNTRFLHTHSNGTSADPHAGRSLRHFLGHTPNLEHLRLNFEKHLVSNNEAFLQWLSEPASTTLSQGATFLDPAPITLPFLKKLELGQLSPRLDLLFAVIRKFAPTLQDLSLWRMNIYAIPPVPFGQKSNFWQALFDKLSKMPQLNLTRLKVGMLQQDHMYVNFKENENARPLKEKEHIGKDMDKFWVQLVEQVSVEWPSHPLPQSDDEEEDDDEDMDDDDEHVDSEDDEDDE